MKPNYALNMTHDGIDLFERNGAEWQVLGTVSLESTDMDGDLTALRQLAERRSPKGLLAKLIIPPSQVLYTRIKAPGPTTAQRKRQISHALDGRTPYAVSDLSFDWSGTGDEVMVAVVAKETLQEAEEFARTHGFAALSFVAQPAPDQYAGEPWFGPTAMAAQYLGEGERVERDQDPVRVTGVIALEDPEHDAPQHDEPEQDAPEAQVDAEASPDAPENETPSEPVAALDPAEFTAPARPADQVVIPDPSPTLDESDQPVDIGEPLAAETFDAPADAALQEPPMETESEEAAQRAVTAADAYLASDTDLTIAPVEAAPAQEDAPLETTPRESAGTESAAVEASFDVITDPVSAPEVRIESPAPAQHWLDSASMEHPVEPAETAQPQDTAAEHDNPSLFDAAQDLPEMQVEDVEGTAHALPEAELPPLTAVTPQAPAPVAAQDKPILARPTFATRHASAAPKPEGGSLGGVATPSTTPETSDDWTVADPALALPPAQPLSAEVRAAIPRVSPKPTRIDLPKSRPTAPAPQEPRASRLPTLNTKRATDAMNLTLAKAAASGASLSKAAQSAAQLATKLARRGGKKSNSDAASPAQNSLRRDAQPILSRGTQAPLTAKVTSDLGQEATPLAPASVLIEPPVAPAMSAEPMQPAAMTQGTATLPAANSQREPLTDATYHAESEETPADAPIAASVSAPYTIEDPFPQDVGAKNGAFAQDEAPFAADVEPLSDTSAAYTPAAPKRKRSVFGAPLASSTKPSRFLMAKLIAVLFLFMGGVALWASYLGGEDSTEIAQSAPSSGASLPVPDPILPTSEPSPEATEPTPESLAPTAEDDATQEASTDLSEPEVTAGETVAQTPVTPDAQPQAPTTTAPPLAQDRLTALATPPSVEGGAPAGLPTTDLTQAEPRQAEPTQAEIAPVIPTESGTVTPSGTVIYAGRPPVTPPARPQSVVTAAEEAAAAAAFPNADPALKGKRPKARPQSVSDAATKAANEAAVTPEIPQIEVDPTDVVTAQGTSEPAQETATAATQTAAAQTETPAPADAPELSAEERAEIATLLSKRPKARPAAINTAAQRAEAAAKAEAEAAAKAEEEARIAAEEEAKRFADATAQAVETSRRPASKPRNIAAAVEAAVAAAVAATPREAPAPALVAAVAPAPAAAPAPAPAATYTPSPAPKPTVMNAPKTQERGAVIDELDEPEPTAPTSRGATPSSVAKQATEKNALNLGKVNLIGLFGSKSNRRALVRMSNGSFVRVKVGDRLDGGQVTAIGDGQLNYQKGGRNVTLTLLAGG